MASALAAASDTTSVSGSDQGSGYVYQLWNSRDREDIRAGDDVFVNLRSDKDTGKAKVLQVIDDPKHKYNGRIKVCSALHRRRCRCRILHADAHPHRRPPSTV